MRLRSLEIKGFKSFAEKTIINFDKDVIGIVGANGCGKSNVVDAMRWVLGEQKSKELRSEKMSNVIFNGTKHRKAGGLAQVSLTFDNTKNVLPTDYNTVTISRTLYRSGESEYHLNSVKCRLKDIKTLIMDTGMGSNSYAIIALGMVDDILNDRENSRRNLIEQAAGISKYKIRKRETLNKLKGTTADLDRVEDLVFELEGQLKTLEKQAKRARKYFEIKATYKELSLELILFQLEGLRQSYKNIETQLETQEAKKVELEAKIHNFEAQLEKEKKANLDKEKALTESQRALNNLVGRIRGMENDKKVIAQKIQFLDQNKDKLTTQIQQAQSRLAQTEEDIEYYRGEVNAEKRLEAKYEEQLEEAEDKLKSIKNNHGSLKTELDDFIKERETLDKAIFELEKKRAIEASQKTNLQSDIVRRQKEIEIRQKEIGTLKIEVEKLKTAQTDKENTIQLLEAQENNRQENIQKIELKLDEVKQKISKINRSLDSKRNEYKLIKSLVDNLEGFPESIKFLNKNQQYKAPLLSDIIYCKEEYRIAIENYLKPYLNYYVVNNLTEAYQAIDLLSNANKGKANFFLQNTLPQQTLLNAPNTACTSALDVVNFDKQYETIMTYLLSDVFVLNNGESVHNYENKTGTFLAQDGRFIKRKHTISGGSVGAFEGKRIGRKKNLEVLQKSITELEQEVAILQKERDTFAVELQQLKKENYRQKIQKERNELNQLTRQTIQQASKLENFETFVKDVNEKNQLAQERIKTFDNEGIKIEQELNNKKAEAQVYHQRVAQMGNSYRLVADEMSKASQNYNQKNIEFIKQQNKINALQRELSFREKQLKELNAQLNSNQSTLNKTNKDLTEAKEEKEKLQEDLVLAYEDKKVKQKALQTAEEAYYDARGGINDLEKELRQVNKTHQETLMLIANFKDKFNELKLKLTSIGERVKIEFDKTINELINQTPNPEYQQAELEIKVEKLKRRLDNYGEINPMAVEAYDEMKERFDTITTQRDDILKAKESLLATIQEIETTATGQFLEAFEQVRTHFKEVFRSLFTEDDNCELILEQPDNPLESPIKIVARPKGKRPLTINQLSGGEKTLTATALLFSLYLLKPAPFCIFDEVDAPLDDTNIGKFNKIIRKFSKDSQFIIVTHNKLTMEAVDTIYGVTMPEKGTGQGVSQVVPVSFEELG